MFIFAFTSVTCGSRNYILITWGQVTLLLGYLTFFIIEKLLYLRIFMVEKFKLDVKFNDISNILLWKNIKLLCVNFIVEKIRLVYVLHRFCLLKKIFQYK